MMVLRKKPNGESIITLLLKLAHRREVLYRVYWVYWVFVFFIKRFINLIRMSFDAKIYAVMYTEVTIHRLHTQLSAIFTINII